MNSGSRSGGGGGDGDGDERRERERNRLRKGVRPVRSSPALRRRADSAVTGKYHKDHKPPQTAST
jgi:hypothetical protein